MQLATSYACMCTSIGCIFVYPVVVVIVFVVAADADADVDGGCC